MGEKLKLISFECEYSDGIPLNKLDREFAAGSGKQGAGQHCGQRFPVYIQED
jgi:hypothetical protein